MFLPLGGFLFLSVLHDSIWIVQLYGMFVDFLPHIEQGRVFKFLDTLCWRDSYTIGLLLQCCYTVLKGSVCTGNMTLVSAQET